MRITRRRTMTLSAASAALPLVHIRTAGAAGKIAIAFWDHWVPAGNEIMRKQVQAWGEANKVEVQMDFITSVGNKILLTAAAEQQAKTGHDVMTFRDWSVQNHGESLEPLDDVMKSLTSRYGPVNPISTYLGTVNGHWVAADQHRHQLQGTGRADQRAARQGGHRCHRDVSHAAGTDEAGR